MAIAIPAEILPILDSLNIRDPANCKWKRVDAWPSRHVRSHFYCPCKTPDTRVDLEHTWLASRRVFIGQCPVCRTIVWRDSVKEG
jgi:hypothetical protein